jgi:hypothetical protein
LFFDFFYFYQNKPIIYLYSKYIIPKFINIMGWERGGKGDST